MAKISSDFKIPKRIGDFVIYPLDGEYIIRRKSGFTKKGMAKDPKYDRSRENAKEFGAVSRLSKNIRMALKEVLPTSNNLAVCNSLTAIMRKVMCCDEVAERGNRSIKNGFETNRGKVFFTGYDFNPNSLFRNVFKGDYHFDIEKRVLNFDSFKTIEAFVFPEGANCVGLRMGTLQFDFDSSVSIFNMTEWSLFRLESTINESLQLGNKDFPDGEGVVFFLLEVAFFVENEGSFIPFQKDDSKVVFVLGVQ
jgi:hypothetical protein